MYPLTIIAIVGSFAYGSNVMSFKNRLAMDN